MKKVFHDLLNDMAVAMGLVQAFLDEKLEPTKHRLEEILRALEHADVAIAQLRADSRTENAPRSQSVLSAVVEGSPFAKILVDANGRIALVNAEAEKLFGYDRAEMLGRSVELLVPQRFKTGHPGLRHSYDQRPVARPMGAGRDLFGRRKDGAEFPIEIGLNPVAIDEGTFTLAAISDITERKRAEELRALHAGIARHASELEALNRELADVSRFKTQFIATMSHELRTPLSAILGAAELLAKAPLPERDRLNVATINESAEALFALIGSILDFSKIEAGKMDLDERPFDIRSVVDSAADVVSSLIREKDVSLHAVVETTIPRVRGDRTRLRQILLNLLGNSVKFTDRGDITVRAFPLETNGDGVRIRFEVRDTGIGISPKFLPTVFEPFAQAGGRLSQKLGGSGLGLSISKRLVEMMGGEIGVASEEGRGTLMWFTAFFQWDESTPVDESQAPPDERGARPRPGSAVSGTVLVAEDDERLQRLLKMQFAELGISVDFVRDGRAAVAAARDGGYAMILMDVQMPDLDGLSATRAIRSDNDRSVRHIAIVAMTADAFSEDRDACIAAGMDDYLAKPVRLADLRAVVERWANRGASVR